MEYESRVPAGFSIDLWKRIAEEAGLAFEFKPVGTLPELLESLKTNQADVFGAISITAARETVIDFVTPFTNPACRFS